METRVDALEYRQSDAMAASFDVLVGIEGLDGCSGVEAEVDRHPGIRCVVGEGSVYQIPTMNNEVTRRGFDRNRAR